MRINPNSIYNMGFEGREVFQHQRKREIELWLYNQSQLEYANDSFIISSPVVLIGFRWVYNRSRTNFLRERCPLHQTTASFSSSDWKQFIPWIFQKAHFYSWPVVTSFTLVLTLYRSFKLLQTSIKWDIDYSRSILGLMHPSFEWDVKPRSWLSVVIKNPRHVTPASWPNFPIGLWPLWLPNHSHTLIGCITRSPLHQ